MADEKTDNLILEHLRHIRSRVDTLQLMAEEHGKRLLRVESGIHALRRDQADDAGAVVDVQQQLDRLQAEVERIKRRLDLVD